MTVARCSQHAGFLPILEPELLIDSPDKDGAEVILLEALHRHLDALPKNRAVMLKLTMPELPNRYGELVDHDRVVRLLGLSGGYSRHEACRRVAANRGMIASFSRALLDDLRCSMSDALFDATLATAVDEIHLASSVKE